MLRPLATCTLLALASPAAQAWNAFGHMVVAAIAYERLGQAPATRAQVDALVQRNPLYAQWVAGVPAAQRARVAFVMAAQWPDLIKRDTRYTDDGKHHGETPVEPVGSQNIGYQDLNRHKYWHYKDVGFSTDGTPVAKPQVPNVETQIKRFRATLASAAAGPGLKSYDLVWLIHLVGDVHQPLHASTRFTADLPHGDVGGNAVALCSDPCRDELHAFWDGALGHDSRASAAIARAQALPPAPAAAGQSTNVDAWVAESVAAAKADAYTSPVGPAGKGPYTLDDAYTSRARQVAEQRIALAGARLATLLRSALK